MTRQIGNHLRGTCPCARAAEKRDEFAVFHKAPTAEHLTIIKHNLSPCLWGEVRVFYDVFGRTAEVLAIVTKSEAESWLAQFGSPE